MDNYEWALGTEPRYGLAAVDPRTFARVPRPCAFDLERVCRTNALP
jgi:beta-glucosidase